MARQNKGLLIDRILRWEHIRITKQTTGSKHIKRTHHNNGHHKLKTYILETDPNITTSIGVTLEMNSRINENSTYNSNYFRWISSIQYPTQETGGSKKSSIVTIKTDEGQQKANLLDTELTAPKLKPGDNIIT